MRLELPCEPLDTGICLPRLGSEDFLKDHTAHAALDQSFKRCIHVRGVCNRCNARADRFKTSQASAGKEVAWWQFLPFKSDECRDPGLKTGLFEASPEECQFKVRVKIYETRRDKRFAQVANGSPGVSLKKVATSTDCGNSLSLEGDCSVLYWR